MTKPTVEFRCDYCSARNFLFINEDRVLNCCGCGGPMPDHVDIRYPDGRVRERSVATFETPFDVVDFGAAFGSVVYMPAVAFTSMPRPKKGVS